MMRECVCIQVPDVRAAAHPRKPLVSETSGLRGVGRGRAHSCGSSARGDKGHMAICEGTHSFCIMRRANESAARTQ